MITSERREYISLNGARIVSYHDYALSRKARRPIIILPPGYGETKRDQISLAYYFVANGFETLRYDHTYHLGESEGSIRDTSLGKMSADLRASISFCRSEFGVSIVGIVAPSLTARVALRVAAEDPSAVNLLVLLVGVVNLRRTLFEIYREDVIDKYKKGLIGETIDLFGHEVSTGFIQEAIDTDCVDLDSSRRDVEGLQCPVHMFVAQSDVWVDRDDVSSLKSRKNGKLELFEIPGALHRVQENPRLAQLTIENIVGVFVGKRSGCGGGKIAGPDIREIARQNRRELRILKNLSTVTKGGEREFWDGYLAKFSIIFKSADYQDLLGALERGLGGFSDRDFCLDAGCGNGHFGVWLGGVIARSPGLELKYMGLDFVPEAVGEARRRHRKIMFKSDLESNLKVGVTFWHLVGDLEEGLPFKEGQFSKICCNLVICYLAQPEKVAQELVRVLSPGGRIVLSSLKPYCDLSLLYRDFALSSRTEDELDEARALLSNSGKIRQKEGEGHYHFFSKEELRDLFVRLGLVDVTVEESFARQATVAAGMKPRKPVAI